jgi:hypothetical protein
MEQIWQDQGFADVEKMMVECSQDQVEELRMQLSESNRKIANSEAKVASHQLLGQTSISGTAPAVGSDTTSSSLATVSLCPLDAGAQLLPRPWWVQRLLLQYPSPNEFVKMRASLPSNRFRNSKPARNVWLKP